MKIEIIAIGNEILSGQTINTNASYISKTLATCGYDVVQHSVLPDQEEAIKQGIEQGLKRADLVITTGGLGPTIDDISRKVVCDIFSTTLEFNPTLAKHLEEKFGKIASLENQATVPKSAILLPNKIGTAQGLVFEKLIMLPGVPQELKSMVTNELVPYLQKNFPIKKKRCEKRFFLCLLTEMQINPTLKKLQEKYPSVKIGIYPSYQGIEVRFNAKEDLTNISKEFEDIFSKNIFSTSSPKIAESLYLVLKDQDKKIILAESCTGGGISYALVQTPGVSKFLLGSFVVYSNELKKKILQISEKTLLEYGAVSTETVNEMLHNAIELTNADYAIAISGIAGPSGGTKEKPIGTICVGTLEKGQKPDVGIIHAKGDRQTVMDYSIYFALSILWQRLQHHKLHFSS